MLSLFTLLINAFFWRTGYLVFPIEVQGPEALFHAMRVYDGIIQK